MCERLIFLLLAYTRCVYCQNLRFVFCLGASFGRTFEHTKTADQKIPLIVKVMILRMRDEMCYIFWHKSAFLLLPDKESKAKVCAAFELTSMYRTTVVHSENIWLKCQTWNLSGVWLPSPDCKQWRGQIPSRITAKRKISHWNPLKNPSSTPNEAAKKHHKHSINSRSRKVWKAPETMCIFYSSPHHNTHTRAEKIYSWTLSEESAAEIKPNGLIWKGG